MRRRRQQVIKKEKPKIMIIRDKGGRMETKEKKTGNVDRERPALWSRDHGAICPLASHLVTGTHGPQ